MRNFVCALFRQVNFYNKFQHHSVLDVDLGFVVLYFSKLNHVYTTFSTQVFKLSKYLLIATVRILAATHVAYYEFHSRYKGKILFSYALLCNCCWLLHNVKLCHNYCGRPQILFNTTPLSFSATYFCVFVTLTVLSLTVLTVGKYKRATD